MVLSLSISPEAESRLKSKAAAAGVDVETYAVRHLELIAASPKSLEEISGPIGEEFARSGMSEDELADFLEAEKHAMRAERREKRGDSPAQKKDLATNLTNLHGAGSARNPKVLTTDLRE